jgi:inner membrane protease ATP23
VQIVEKDPFVKRLIRETIKIRPASLRAGVTCRVCQGTTQAKSVGYYDSEYGLYALHSSSMGSVRATILMVPWCRIVLCCDRLRSPDQVQSTLLHELVHAYDHALRLAESSKSPPTSFFGSTSSIRDTLVTLLLPSAFHPSQQQHSSSSPSSRYKTCEDLICTEIRAAKIGQCRNVWSEYRRKECVRREARQSCKSSHVVDSENGNVCAALADMLIAAKFQACYDDNRPFE